MNFLYVEAFESYCLTDKQADRHDLNYIPRCFAGGQNYIVSPGIKLVQSFVNTGVAAASSSRRKYNTAPLMKLQPISDDDESGPSDYERIDDGGQRDDDCPSAPLLHTTGNIQRSIQLIGTWTSINNFLKVCGTKGSISLLHVHVVCQSSC